MRFLKRFRFRPQAAFTTTRPKTFRARCHPSRPRHGAPWHGPSPAPTLRVAPPGGSAAGRAGRQGPARRPAGDGTERPRRASCSHPGTASGGPSEARADSRQQLDCEHRLYFPAERHGGCAVRGEQLLRELVGWQPSSPHGTAPGAAPPARGSPPFPEMGE